MSAAKKKATAKAVETVEAYKAFGPGMVCRGFQFEVGQTYTHVGKVAICDSGFHACEMPLDCWRYYPPGSPVARVSLSGKLDRNDGDSKVCGSIIAVTAALDLPDFISAGAEWIIKAAKGNAAATGDYSHAAATGDYSHAAATGYCGNAAVKGKNAIAAALGPLGTATAEKGGAIMLARYDDDGNLVAVFSSLVGENGIEPGKTYRLGKDGPETVS